MPRGENKEFKKRVGRLSEPLIKKNLESMIKKRTKVHPDQIDLEAIVDETLDFGENLDNLKQHLEQDIDKNPEENIQHLKSDLEKYSYKWEKYAEKHGIT